jgi:hypothetical protein
MLSDDERRALACHEKVIDGGRQIYLAVGRALTAIRDGKLYRESHPTFAVYARGRWQLSRSKAYRCLDAVEVVDVLSPNGDVPPSEAVVRALVPLRGQHEALRAAWDEARDQFGDRPTAKQVQGVVQRKRPPDEEQKRRPRPAPATGNEARDRRQN